MKASEFQKTKDRMNFSHRDAEQWDPRHWNNRLACIGVSFTSGGEGASLLLVDRTSSDGVTIKVLYGVDVL